MEQKETLSTLSPMDELDVLELAKHCKPRISLSTIEAKVNAEKTEESKTALASEVHHNVKRLIMLTIAVPFLSTSRCYEILGLNYREGNAAKTEAVNKKILIQHSFHSGKQGGKSVLLEPSRAAFARFGMPFPYMNPGFLHRYMQHQAKEAMTEQGYKATLEKLVKGKNIDVVLEKGGERVAVEIAVSAKYEVVNVRKDIFQAGFDRVVIVGKDKKVVTGVKKKIGAAFDRDVLAKVRCCVLADLVGKVTE